MGEDRIATGWWCRLTNEGRVLAPRKQVWPHGSRGVAGGARDTQELFPRRGDAVVLGVITRPGMKRLAAQHG